MIVGFWDNCLCERGTTVGLYNYAMYNESILGNKSYIFYDKNLKSTKKEVLEKFENKFTVHGTDNFNEVDFYLRKYGITHIFIIKSGELDNRISRVAKNCIQCVFTCSQPHGQIYCSIAEWVHKNNGKYPVIPRIISLPSVKENMRKDLNIPEDSIVFGRHGGPEGFNIKFVKKLIIDKFLNNEKYYFIFVNTDKFCEAKNIIYLNTIYDATEIVKFINTCDAMLWARAGGETFGQAIAEFSIKNKPVIATKNVNQKIHIKLLGEKAIWYNNERDLEQIIKTFNKKEVEKKDWNAFRDYSPENVMKIFNEVFLENDRV